jgi:predicted dehydrogenase
VPTPLPITDRPVRIAVVGLGQIAELCLPPYLERDDVEIVGLCDVEPQRIERWANVFPAARTTTDVGTLVTFDADVVDVLVPTPRHCEVVTQVLHAGFHVQVQKPLARSLDEADRMLAARRDGAVVRVMEDYVCFPPLAKLREVVESGELGPAQSMHMKIVATANGGWDVNPASYVWQFEQARDGHGILTFDHGWHQLAVAHWLFGPVRRVFGWVRKTPIAPKDAPEVVLDAPATFVWEHDNDVRVVLDVTLAPEMYFRSDFYADDERVEVTGSRGYVRCNRISGRGVQEPSVVVYRDGEVRQYHALDDQPPDAFAASAANGIDYFRTANGPLLFDGETARAILATLLTALESAARGVPLDVER